MASAVRPESPDREGSCFSRAARAIRRALSRICGDTSTSILHHAPPKASRGTLKSSIWSEAENEGISLHRSSDHGRRFELRPKRHLGSLPAPRPDYESLNSRRDTSSRVHIHGMSFALKSVDSVLELQRAPIRNRLIWDSTDTEGSKEQDDFKMMSVGAESESGDVSDALVTEAVVRAENYSAANAKPTRPNLQMSSDPGWSKRDSSCLSRSLSVPSLSQRSSAENKTFTRSQSLPDVLIKRSSEEGHTFMPCSLPIAPAGMSQDQIYGSFGLPFHPQLHGSHSHKIIKRGCKDSFFSAYFIGDANNDNAIDHSRDDSDIYIPDFYGKRARTDWMNEYDEDTTSVLRAASHAHEGYFPSSSSQTQDQNLLVPDRKDTDDGGSSFDNSSPTFSRPSCSQSTAPTVCGPPCPQDSPVVSQDSTVCTEGSRAQDDDVLIEMETSDTALNLSVTNNQSTHSHLQLSSSDPGWSERDSGCLSRSHSVPSLSQTTSPENKTFTRSQSLPDMLLKSSFEEFTPDIIDDEDDETYWFQCSCPGLYQCSVTGLVFHMEGEGDVVYRTVPWDRRLLAQHHKQPAGPLFDIKCLQQSVCQLHLPHCEIRSTGGCEFLSVAHVNDEDIEFIVPQKITETHVIINITGFSAFGNVKDEDSPPDPVRALVLLFYRPPADPDPESLLNVLLLPVNIVLRDVLRTRKKLAGDEIYIETSPKCKLSPNQEYTLSTCPEDDSVLVQPTEAEFDCDNYDNYFPSFQVILEKLMKHIKLFLRETKSSKSVWERRVCLSSAAVKRSCGPSALNLPPNDRLLDIRSSFIDGISGPVLRSLLDKLLEKTVLTKAEEESAEVIQNHRDKARFVFDTVRKKGEAASSEMIEFLCVHRRRGRFFCEHLGLI